MLYRCIRDGVSVRALYNGEISYVRGGIYKVHPFDGDLLVLLSVGSSGLYEEYLCSIEDFVSIEDYRDNQLKELGI